MPTEQPYDPNQVPEPFNQDKFYEEWQSGKKPLVDAIMSNYTKPVPTLTPEKAKFGSALTDTFSSLAEMFAHGQGARIRNREGASNQQTTNAKLQAYQDKYDQEMQRYGGMKANAELMDFNKKLELDRMNSQEKRQYYLNKQLQVEKAAALARQIANDSASQAARTRGLDIQENGQKITAGHYANVDATAKANLNRTTKDNFSGLVINAHPSDQTAQTDATGRKVVSIPLNKEQILGMANSAKNDPKFMKNHPELLVDKPDFMGVPHKGLTTDQEIAWAYAQEKYNNKFAPPVPKWKKTNTNSGNSSQFNIVNPGSLTGQVR